MPIVLLLMLAMPYMSFAQDIPVSGTVRLASDQSTMPGVTVTVKGTQMRTVTNSQGKYGFAAVKADATLVFTFIGYTTQEVKLNNRKTVDAALVEAQTNLDEAIVVGYGTQKRSHFAGASSTINVEKDKIDEVPIESLDKALEGRIAGVQIRESGGEVGQNPDINIRGTASFSAGTSPLIVVDGLPIAGTLSDINANDVAKIDILKDAASTAIYGSRGANGVILVTTKKGSPNKTSFSVKYNSGASNVLKYYDTFGDYQEFARNAYRKAIAPWESDYLRAGQAVPSSGFDVSGKALVSPGGKTYISWDQYFTNKLNPATGTVYDVNGAGYYNVYKLDQLENPQTPQQSVTQTGLRNMVTVSARGGTDKTTFYISGGYENTGGVMINNSFQAVSLTANMNAKINNKLSVDLSVMPRVKTIRAGSNAQLGGALRWLNIPLTYSALDLKTVLSAAEGGYVSPTVQVGDYVKSRDFSRTWLMNDDFTDFVYTPAGAKIRVLTYSQTPGTTSYSDASDSNDTQNIYLFTGNLGINWTILPNLRFRTTIGAYVNYNNHDTFTGSFKNSAGVSTSGFGKDLINTTMYRNLINENTLTYDMKLGKHNLSFLAGLSGESGATTGTQVQGNFLDNDDIRSITTASEITATQANNNKSEETLFSVFGRVNYDYAGKYILSLVMRRDGSSKFGPDNRFGSFPSISAAWRISEEGFIKKYADVLSDLRLRASYGVSGNNKILNYAYTTGVNKTSYTFDGTVTTGYAANSNTLGNANIGWEQTNEANLGLSMGLLKNRINLNFDVYYNKTKQLLLQNPIVDITGHDFQWQNIGSVQNKGLEIDLSSVNLRKKNFQWMSNLNFSMTRNKLVDYGGADQQFFSGYVSSVYRLKVGRPLGEFYGYKTDGSFYKTTAEINAAIAAGTAYTGTAPGDLKFMDTNGDGKITPDDKTSLGSVYPTFEFGIGNSFTYKNFDLSFQIQGSHGAKVQNFSNIFGANYLRWLNVDSFVDEFHGSVPNASSTSITSTDFFVEDASYYTLRDASIGFTIPKKKIRIYFSGRNLIYLMGKGYHGVNPEFQATISGNLIRGEQRITTTALLRTYTFGLNLDF